MNFLFEDRGHVYQLHVEVGGDHEALVHAEQVDQQQDEQASIEPEEDAPWQ